MLKLSEIDLGDNQLGDSGIVAIMGALVDNHVALNVVKLFKNNFGSRGGEAICSLIAKAPMPPAEVHLSHNLLGPHDVLCLVKEAAGRKEYPLRDAQGGKTVPLWLRVERQRASLWNFEG